MPSRFAVIIPVWNGAAHLAEAIESVRAQTVDDCALVVVDDGSDDDSSEVASRRGVRVIRLPRNEGVLAARRAGFEATRSDAVVFLDADDRLRPTALERFGRALDRHDQAVGVYGDRVLIDEAGAVFGSERGALLSSRRSGDALPVLLSRNFLSTPAQLCARRSAMAATETETWRTDLRRMADWYLWCRLALQGPFAYLGRGPVVEYRMHASSMARSLAEADLHEPAIDELTPALDAVFSMPELSQRFSARALTRLRRKAEAGAYAWKGQELLRRGNRSSSRMYFRSALRSNPRSLVDMLALGLTYLPRIPGAFRPWIGNLEGAKSNRSRRR